MILGTFAMPATLERVDDTVIALKAEAADVLTGDMPLRLEICLAEALTNHIVHRSRETNEKIGDIELRKIPGGVSVSIFDAPGSDPFDIRDMNASFDDIPLLAESGRGVALILSCADHIRYEPCGPTKRLTLEFTERQANEQ